MVLGKEVDDDAEVVRLSAHERAAHLYCTGITGSGKTRWLQHLICSDLAVGQPVVVLDPFGGLYRAVREFVATGLEQAMAAGFDGQRLLQRYRFLDLNDPANPLRINPLAPHLLETVEQQVDDLMKGVARLLGGNLEEQRKLRNVLRGVFSLTAELNRLPVKTLPPYLQPLAPFTLGFGAEILNMTDQQRQLLLNLVPPERRSDFRRQYWQFFAGLNPFERNQLVQSSWNVFQYLLDDEIAARFFGPVSTIDLPQWLRDGTSLICFLPVGANLAGARLVGKYLTTKLQHSAYRRTVDEREQSVHLYLDEFHQWTDQAFADALTNLRQFGVNVTCAHQSQTQPPFDTDEGRALLRAIQANSRLKAIFRLARPDAEDLAREVFALSQQRRNFEAVDQTIGSSEQRGSTRGTSSSTEQSTRNVSGTSHSHRTVFGDTDGDQMTHGQTRNQTVSTGERSGFEQSETVTHGRSESATVRTVYFTLDGERELLVNALQELPQRQFYFAGEPLQGRLLEAPFVPDELYSYAAGDLPAELMEWQRGELAAGLEEATEPLVTLTASERVGLPRPAESWEISTAPEVEAMVDDEIVDLELEEIVDEGDPFLD